MKKINKLKLVGFLSVALALAPIAISASCDPKKEPNKPKPEPGTNPGTGTDTNENKVYNQVVALAKENKLFNLAKGQTVENIKKIWTTKNIVKNKVGETEVEMVYVAKQKPEASTDDLIHMYRSATGVILDMNETIKKTSVADFDIVTPYENNGRVHAFGAYINLDEKNEELTIFFELKDTKNKDKFSGMFTQKFSLKQEKPALSVEEQLKLVKVELVQTSKDKLSKDVTIEDFVVTETGGHKFNLTLQLIADPAFTAKTEKVNVTILLGENQGVKSKTFEFVFNKEQIKDFNADVTKLAKENKLFALNEGFSLDKLIEACTPRNFMSYKEGTTNKSLIKFDVIDFSKPNLYLAKDSTGNLFVVDKTITDESVKSVNIVAGYKQEGATEEAKGVLIELDPANKKLILYFKLKDITKNPATLSEMYKQEIILNADFTDKQKLDYYSSQVTAKIKEASKDKKSTELTKEDFETTVPTGYELNGEIKVTTEDLPVEEGKEAKSRVTIKFTIKATGKTEASKEISFDFIVKK
ncbi:hypothetical protein [Mycoplasma crocodyli]|uniref:Putative lipoprotein n=1 Tax=Mycoplasma crocodyli (strain ATCC 51981 / MP145) TaxID=512564 RepID=D5E556_MYCCM|nr:hypothetical protein [Mycoplasma crocodyli]ADE19465.1 putative lipoprotein [Mycoplasma crocodyli MP145]